ncbi:hypothetical protein JYU34_022365, partial [Plutella xylostella]
MAQMQNEFAERFEGLASKITAYEKHMQEKDNLILDLKSQVAVLQEQVDRQSHESLRSELDILGLTETPNENPYHLVLTTAQKIELTMDERDLDYVRRVGPRGKEAEDRLPRPLVVSFTRRTKREEFLKQAKARRCLDSKDVAGSGPERKMYVNERLTLETDSYFGPPESGPKIKDSNIAGSEMAQSTFGKEKAEMEAQQSQFEHLKIYRG